MILYTLRAFSPTNYFLFVMQLKERSVTMRWNVPNFFLMVTFILCFCVCVMLEKGRGILKDEGEGVNR